ncbi:MAG TPA: hypothetical protein VEB21_10150 [Terriglobales bacterium]|nr:hypothetical protein [Terriglobales bacterium]
MRALTATLLLACAVLSATGCASLRRAKAGDVLAADLRQIQPLHDRDHYVYVWQRLVDGNRQAEGIHVEHVSALPASGQFEIDIAEDGAPSARLRMSYDERLLALIDEEDLSQGIRLTYSPPLPQLVAPLVVGEQQLSATASIRRLQDGDSIEGVAVTQSIRVRQARKVESELGNYDDAVAVRTKRRVHTPAGAIVLDSAVLLVPGIGEIRSEGSTSAPAPPGGVAKVVVTRRELACAIIAGKAIGDCRKVPEQLARLRAQP